MTTDQLTVFIAALFFAGVLLFIGFWLPGEYEIARFAFFFGAFLCFVTAGETLFHAADAVNAIAAGGPPCAVCW